MNRSDARFAKRRAKMVTADIAGRGIMSVEVLSALRAVPRERFVSDDLAELAYSDQALPIAEGQTISQPYIVARMAEAAEVDSTSRVLEIGTGSGYGAAVLSMIAGQVWSIERHRRLAESARVRLSELGFDNVHVLHGDGTMGHPDAAPFDAIIVTAAARQVPDALVAQLVVGGRLIMPVGGSSGDQQLRRISRTEAGVVEDNLGLVRFVPLVAD